MGRNSDDAVRRETGPDVTFPESLTAGATVLLASAGDPSQYLVDLRALCRYGTADDVAFVITTTMSVEDIIDAYDQLCPPSDRPALRFVDTTSAGQSVSVLYGEPPVVLIPSLDDLERLVLGLSDLSGTHPPATGARHLVIQSLTPLLETTATAHVCSILERITGLRSERGLCLLGLDYTAHDEATMSALTEHVEGILWVTQTATDRLDLEYQPGRGRYTR
jgi:hypothetical protein